MNVKEFLKFEFSGWKRLEGISLVLILLFIFSNAYLTKDNTVSVVSATCGILYTIIAGKGKISCYFFGLLGSSFYGYLAFQNALYGNLLLYVAYYIPMQILGTLNWKKHLRKENNEIIKTKLTNKERIRITTISIIASISAIIILKFFNGSNPYIDGLTTALSLIGMYLTVKRCIEQWIIWTIVNALSVLMWVNVVLHGQKAYATVIMWAVYLALGIYFYFQWQKDISNISQLKKAQISEEPEVDGPQLICSRNI